MKYSILAKYNEKVNDDKKKGTDAKNYFSFQELTQMEGIHGVEVITNVITRPNRYDLLIRIDMDKEALTVYDKSEPHKIWKRDYAKYLEKKTFFEYE